MAQATYGTDDSFDDNRYYLRRKLNEYELRQVSGGGKPGKYGS